MKARIQRWGNSLALRIPKAFAAEAGLAEDAAVDLSIERGKLVVNPIVTDPVRLDDLLGAITPDNLHGEWETGPAVGRESW